MRADGIGPGTADVQVAEQIEIQAKYAGYLARQQHEVERSRAEDARALPAGWSAAAPKTPARVRPATIGQAGRIPGVTPAAVSLLLIHLKRRSA